MGDWRSLSGSDGPRDLVFNHNINGSVMLFDSYCLRYQLLMVFVQLQGWMKNSVPTIINVLELKFIMIGALSLCCLGDLIPLTSSKDQMSRSRRLDRFNI